jgi:hypothetical protein
MNEKSNALVSLLVFVLIILLLATGLFAYLYYEELNQEPVEVVKEVPVDVIREVEVPVEVIKEVEVPVEVVKEVVVVKEVEKPLGVIEEIHLLAGEQLWNASMANPSGYSSDEVFRIYDDFKFMVFLCDETKKLVSEQEVTDKIELALRSNGIKINSNSSGLLFFSFFRMDNPDSKLDVWSTELNLIDTLYHMAGEKSKRRIVKVWGNGNFGTVGEDKFKGSLLNYAQKLAENVALTYLRQKDAQKLEEEEKANSAGGE